MEATVQFIVIDCPDSEKLVLFYQALLGGEVNRPDPKWASLGDGWSTLHLPTGLVLCFKRLADYQPPQWPDPRYPRQIHLDFGVRDLTAASREAQAAGAKLLDDSHAEKWIVFADPAGHPFCLAREATH